METFKNDMKKNFNPKNSIDFVFGYIDHMNKSRMLTPEIFIKFIEFAAYKYETGDENDRRILKEKLDELVKKTTETK